MGNPRESVETNAAHGRGTMRSSNGRAERSSLKARRRIRMGTPQARRRLLPRIHRHEYEPMVRTAKSPSGGRPGRVDDARSPSPNYDDPMTLQPAQIERLLEKQFGPNWRDVTITSPLGSFRLADWRDEIGWQPSALESRGLYQWPRRQSLPTRDLCDPVANARAALALFKARNDEEAPST